MKNVVEPPPTPQPTTMPALAIITTREGTAHVFETSVPLAEVVKARHLRKVKGVQA